MDKQLVALYELKRQSFLIGYIQNPENFSDALAFAYFYRVAPVLHENVEREIYEADPFEDVYAVKTCFVEEVLKYIDKCWRDARLSDIEFYKLEEKFGGYKTNRIELLHILEYLRIAGRFDTEVWSAIESNAPAEANSIGSTFSPGEVTFD
ncbi:hypothetical protein [Rhodomicrobium sp.]|uniref:hypothetical protein n=1 Tax=Rhodomicrobium sp. TaxID=2720632 RepID=UPI0039E3659A